MVYVFFAASVSYGMGWVVYRALRRRGIVDRPNDRSSHTDATVRGGGLSIMFAVILASVIAGTLTGSLSVLLAMLSAAAVIAAVSFVDDLRSLPATIRLGCHVLAATLVIAVMTPHGVATDPISEFPTSMAAWVGFGSAIFWVVGYTNAFNFMDGINGIAAGQAAVSGFGMALLVGLTQGGFGSVQIGVCMAITGAAAGFFPHNFPRARMFMGDVGSAPLGFLLSTLVLWLAASAGWWLLVPLVLLHANFVLDTGITLLRRVARGEPFYQAHREHFYQRLVRAGRSHSFVTSLEMGIQVVVVLLLVWYLSVGTSMRLLIGCVILGMWCVFFLYAEHSFRRFQASQLPIPPGRT